MLHWLGIALIDVTKVVRQDRELSVLHRRRYVQDCAHAPDRYVFDETRKHLVSLIMILGLFSVLALALGLPANTTIDASGEVTTNPPDETTEAPVEGTTNPPDEETTEALGEVTTNPPDEETTEPEDPGDVTTNPPDEGTTEAATTTTTKAAPEGSTTVMEGSTSLPPLVPCPFECPAEFGYFEVEPCSPFYCSCSNNIGYLQAMINPIFIFQLLSMN